MENTEETKNEINAVIDELKKIRDRLLQQKLEQEQEQEQEQELEPEPEQGQ